MTTPHITLKHYTDSDLAEIRQTLLDVHTDAYAARMTEPFVQRFPWFVDHWAGKPGFSCVIVYDSGGQAIGFTYGAPSEAGREWWREYVNPAPADTSTFAVSELMLRVNWRGRGLGRQLHEALVGARDEALAVLTVDTKRPKLRAMYGSWGYRNIGEQQPFPDSPMYAVMLLDLRDGN